jgi:hypothetical protein
MTIARLGANPKNDLGGKLMKRLSGVILAGAVLLIGAVAARPVLADDVDPTDPVITLSSSTTGPGAAETFTWVYTPTAVPGGSDGTSGTISFENTSGVTWTSIQVLADYSTTGHTFSGATTTAFTGQGSSIPTTLTTATFTFLGGTGVPNDDYLVFQWTNWNLNSGSSLPIFNFTANGGGSTGVPEPSSVALLAVGLFALLGFAGFQRNRLTNNA